MQVCIKVLAYLELRRSEFDFRLKKSLDYEKVTNPAAAIYNLICSIKSEILIMYPHKYFSTSFNLYVMSTLSIRTLDDPDNELSNIQNLKIIKLIKPFICEDDTFGHKITATLILKSHIFS